MRPPSVLKIQPISLTRPTWVTKENLFFPTSGARAVLNIHKADTSWLSDKHLLLARAIGN